MSNTSFAALQTQFAAHLRDPNQPPPDGLEDRRLAIYRDLFFNNVSGTLSSGFPVLRRIVGDTQWRDLCRRFYKDYGARTPLFHRLSGEFAEWIATLPEDAGLPPFAAELAHYEWVELEVLLRDPDPGPSAVGMDVMHTPLVRAAPVEVLSYGYPVHQIGPDCTPTAPGEAPTCLVVYRNRQEQVRFMATNPLSNALLLQWDATPVQTGEAALIALATELGLAADAFLAPGVGILQHFIERDILTLPS